MSTRVNGPVGELAVGSNLRAAREQKGISLREFAKSVNLSASALSQIETGRSRPSVESLYSITTALGVSIDGLFKDNPHRTPVTVEPPPPVGVLARQDTVSHSTSRRRIDLGQGVHWAQLTNGSDPDVDFLEIHYQPGASSGNLMRHNGREYGMVLDGVLTVTVAFDDFDVGPDDSICFESTLPHRLANNGTELVRAIWFVVGRRSQDAGMSELDAV